MSYHEILTIIIAVGALAFSIYTFIMQQKSGKSKSGFDARQKIDELISTPEISLAKEELVRDYFGPLVQEHDGKAIFSKSTPQIRKDVKLVLNAYDKVCSWYEEKDWVDKENFEKVYAEKITRTWNLLKDEIEENPNTEFCSHFRNVAKIFKDKGYDKPVYKGTHM